MATSTRSVGDGDSAVLTFGRRHQSTYCDDTESFIDTDIYICEMASRAGHREYPAPCRDPLTHINGRPC